ncbi:MAG: hypothetical protein R3B70_15310 [Polyangiaceae bacterium]
MKSVLAVSMAALVGVVALSGSALAKDEYVVRIPNGNVKSCLNCHPGNNTNVLNSFAMDTSNQVGKPAEQWWAGLVDLDSDGDGQTNGEELGDPCGEWLIGLDPPRTTDISNPGDPASTSADPDSPECDPNGSGGGGPTGGNTTSTTTGAGAGAGTGAGAGNGVGGGDLGGGQGGEFPSSGAGKAAPPLATPGSCSTSPATPGAAWDIGLLTAAAYFLLRYRRSRR